ncbi:MAG: cytochrome c oxidase subunit 3 family protein [Bacteroidetes bacterium]|nr:cytochrome c oxidase subunit 3 family protein [Bacteroidota bacterium]
MSEKGIHIEEHRDDEASKLGMWLFIFTELLLFGGLFLVYSIYRWQYPVNFHEASLELSVTIGVINTIVLLFSSMTIAMALTAIQKNNKKLALRLIAVTLLMALIFLINKYFEWGHKFEHGLYPGSDLMALLERGHLLYFSLYFFMTGLHALHIIVGMILLIIAYFKVKKDSVNSDRFVFLENGALYWHLVDLIWIFLFPLMYLIT